MPVKSEAQRRLMFAALRDPKGVGIPRSVAEKFVGPKAHAEGGTVKKESPAMKKGGTAKYAQGGEINAGRGTRGGPTAKELEDHKKGMDFYKKMYPEEFTGAGRGTRGGPTAEEMRKYHADKEAKKNRGIYTAEMGPPPQDIDGGSVKPTNKYAKGGRIDGCAQRGKTKGTMR